MHGTMRGEHIARIPSPERSGPSWCKNPKRVASAGDGVSASFFGRGRSEADRDSGAPAGWTSNRLACEACERSLGESLSKAADGQPWKGRNPGEHPAAGGLNLCRDARDSWKGEIPGTAAYLGRPNASATGAPIGETVGGLIWGEYLRIPFGRRKLRRVNPMSAAGVKQNRHGIEGRKPPRG